MQKVYQGITLVKGLSGNNLTKSGELQSQLVEFCVGLVLCTPLYYHPAHSFAGILPKNKNVTLAEMDPEEGMGRRLSANHIPHSWEASPFQKGNVNSTSPCLPQETTGKKRSRI